MIKVKGINYKINNKEILNNISFEINKGEITVLIGPNGTGKTTLMRLITGDLIANEGEIIFDGKLLKEYTSIELSKKRSYLSQSRNITFPFSAEQIVLMGRFPHTIDGEYTQNDYEITHEVMKDLNLLSLKKKLYQNLSGGEKSRIDLSRVFSQMAEYIFLDEPFNQLDPLYISIILKYLNEIKNNGKTIFLIMHDINLASSIADKIILMKNNQIFKFGKPIEVLTYNNLKLLYDIKFKLHKLKDCRYYYEYI